MTIEGQMMPAGRTLAEATKNFKWIFESSSSDIVFRKTRSYQLLEEAVKIIDAYSQALAIAREDFQRVCDNVGWNDTNAETWHNTDPDEVEI